MFPDEDTLCLPSIGDGAAADRRLLLMHKIRGRRLLHGDERRYTTDSARQKAQEAGCPHGCACAYTWTHAFFFCTHDSLVALRHQCRRALADLEVLDQVILVLVAEDITEVVDKVELVEVVVQELLFFDY